MSCSIAALRRWHFTR